MKKFYAVLLFLFVGITLTTAQSPIELAKEILTETASDFGLSTSDLADLIVTDHHISNTSQVKHIYLRQRFQGLEIFGANASVHLLPNGQLLKINNDFLPSINTKIPSSLAPRLDARQAIHLVAEQMGYTLDEPLESLPLTKPTSTDFLFSKGQISLAPIPASLMLLPMPDGNLRLVWEISLAETTGQNWWNMRVDAITGRILDRNNWINSCNFKSPEMTCKHEAHQDYSSRTLSKNLNHLPSNIGGYNVYAVPVESPNHGERTLQNDPDNLTASPFGWHDTNGTAGAEYTITRGNNVWAYDDAANSNSPGYSPDGGASLNFDFPYDVNGDPTAQLDPIVTNLFYWNNILHDVMYLYGFDEASGNFQETNYGNEGFGSDFVNAEAQDGSGTNNANFATPPDGSNPRMQMYLFNNSAHPHGFHDSSLDNGIIMHEYGHGISNRLTGGGSNADCINNSEQMGEGWSDWYGLLLTIEVGDTGEDARGVGTYAIGNTTNGPGTRQYQYTTDMSINPHTYDDIGSVSIPHGVGTVWCAMLWEMTWALIDKYGFDPDIYNGTGGNNIALKLVNEALKLQPCSPGFVDGRDAILAADQALYGSANSCEIWNAFAKRGLGVNADQGSPNLTSDGTEDFETPADIPSICSTDPTLILFVTPANQTACLGDDITYTVNLTDYNDFNEPVTLSASMLPSGVIPTFSPMVITSYPATSTLTISNTNALESGDYTIEVTGMGISQTKNAFANLKIITEVPEQVVLGTPTDNSIEIITPNFTWSAVENTDKYRFELATDASMNTIIHSTELSQPNYNYNTESTLDKGTYYWRVTAINPCGEGISSDIFSFAIQICGATFTDSGGIDGDYQNNENITYSICPDETATYVVVTFSSFNLESGWDYMHVYDGINDSAPLIGSYTGTSAPGIDGVVESTHSSGCLTIVFNSDNIISAPGWEATIACSDCVRPVIDNISSTNPYCPNSNDGSITVTATSDNELEYTISNTTETITNTSGVFMDLATGTYTLSIHEVDDISCKAILTNIELVAENIFNLEEINITNVSCETAADGSIVIINNDYSGEITYTLTQPDESTQTNTTGEFTALNGGTYQISATDLTHPECSTFEKEITIQTLGVSSPVITPLTFCTGEELPNGANLVAVCEGDLVAEETFTVSPGLLVNSNTPVCVEIPVSDFTNTFSDLAISLNITHDWVGDLYVTIESPSGTVQELFNGPFCSQDNLNVTFWDGAANTYDNFLNTCNTSSTGVLEPGPPYAIEGIFQPSIAFSNYLNEDPNGTWKICFSDNFPSADDGIIEEVSLLLNPSTGNVRWWDAATEGNVVANTSSFDPIEAGLVNKNVSGTYEFWAQCYNGNGSCNSERVSSTLTIVPNIIFVDAAAQGEGTGLSWANAFVDLQAAIEMVRTTDCTNKEIWVAKGTYTPTLDRSGQLPSTDPRRSVFFLDTDVKIYGGFSGNENMLSERNITENPTIFSGDIGTVGDANDNVYNIIETNNVTSDFIIDGVIIEGSKSNSAWLNNGSGTEASPTITNCIFRNNTGASLGAAFYNSGGNNGTTMPTFTNCIFTNNTANNGGVFYDFGDNGTSQARFINCAFYDNKATNLGGVIGIDDATIGRPEFVNCTFHNNTAANGGVIGVNWWDSGQEAVLVRNCIAWGNSSTFGVRNTGQMDIDYTLAQEGDCIPNAVCGDNMIFESDPLFSSAPTSDFQLTRNSPVIDKGDSTTDIDGNNSFSTIQDIETDLAGQPRMTDGDGDDIAQIDMGAFEFQNTLAVEWLSFTASIKNTKGKLQWQVANEASTKYYEVLHKGVNDKWAVIGRVAPQNNSKSYTYWHEQLVEGVNYYQINEVDRDGKKRPSEIKTLILNHANKGIQLFPNPTANKLKIIRLGNANENASLKIFNTIGQEIQQVEILNMQLEIDLDQLPTGIYWLVIDDGINIFTERVIKE